MHALLASVLSQVEKRDLGWRGSGGTDTMDPSLFKVISTKIQLYRYCLLTHGSRKQAQHLTQY